MADKYNPEKDYAGYKELAEEQKKLEDRIAELVEQRDKLRKKIETYLVNARKAVNFEVIKTAAHEYQVEILNEITKAVIESNNLEKAVKLIDHLETHLEARLRISPQRKKEELPPSVSPAIAARKAQEKRDLTAEEKLQAGAPPSSREAPKGRVVERRTVVGDHLSEICRYEYENRRLVRMVFLDPRRKPLRTHQLIYGDAGNVTREIHIDRAGATLQVFEREYDKEGKIRKEEVRDPHNELIFTVHFNYDRHGRLTKKEWRDARNKRTKSWEYRYEKDSREPSKIIWRDERNKPYGSVELGYDDKGHIIKELSRDRSGDEIRSINYQYFYG